MLVPGTGLNRILIRGPNWVGDSVLAIPTMKAVRTQLPQAEITLLVRPWVAGLFTSAPFIDRVWSEPRPSNLREWSRIAGAIRRNAFDLALLLPNSFESALMMFLGRIPQRVGYKTDSRGWLLTTGIPPAQGSQHQVDYYLDLARAILGSFEKPSIQIHATSEERANARKVLKAEGVPENAPFLVLNPGAAYGSAKRWHEDRFARTATTLAREKGLHVAIIGSVMERPIGEAVRAQMNGKAAVLSGKTSLETLIGVLAESSLMITNDSGPMHIAAALGVPTVAVFGATDETVTGPCGARTRIVKHAVECSPCMLRECPIDHRCMTGVEPGDVCRAARELMNGQK
jgi:heptosyltransferase-2